MPLDNQELLTDFNQTQTQHNMKKNPFRSLTIWGTIVTALGMLLRPLGVDVNQEATLDFIEYVQSVWPVLVQAFGLLMAIVGRWRADQPLSVRKASRLP